MNSFSGSEDSVYLQIVFRYVARTICLGRSFRGCVLYRKTLSEIYGEIMRDGVSESNRPLFSAPSIMLISIAVRLMEEGGVSAPNALRSLSLSFSFFLTSGQSVGAWRSFRTRPTVHNALDLQLLQIHPRSVSIPQQRSLALGRTNDRTIERASLGARPLF